MNETEYRPQVTMYLRSLPPTDSDQQQRTLLERLRTMERAGDIAGVEVEIWGERIPSDPETTAGQSILNKIEALEAWSGRAGTSLAPFFQRRMSGSLLTEDTAESIAPPICCIVEHEGDTIHHVAPCIDDGTVKTVADRLDIIESGRGDIRQVRATNV